ncbi:DUF5677 domain-containing protein [Streptomyces malaysiensis]|uniref:DUF5677 domain-containing protein n=1 Tax=Streptomyces malaysiensis TaxID=92644 RepID=UPI00367E9FC8
MANLENSEILKYALEEVNGAIRRGELVAGDDEGMNEAVVQAVENAVERSELLTPTGHAWLRRKIEEWRPVRRKKMAKVRRANLRRWGRGLRYYENCIVTSEVLNKMLEDCIGAWVLNDRSVISENLLGVEGVMGGKGLKCLTLLSLQSRACSIVNEIGLLSEHGYPEAVMARTRSLHELAVVAHALSAHGLADTSVSDRYGAWTVAEAKKEWRVLSGLGMDPDALSGIDAELQVCAEATWGSDFFKQNGWASPLFPGRRPPIPLSDIETLVGMNHMRQYYLAGNDAIHAGPRALAGRSRFRGGAIFPTSSEVQHETTRYFLAVSAITLAEICAAACEVVSSITEDFDALFALKAMGDAVEQARGEFESGGMRP